MTRPRLLTVRRPDGRTIGYYPEPAERGCLLVHVPVFEGAAVFYPGLPPPAAVSIPSAFRVVKLSCLKWQPAGGGEPILSWYAAGELRDLVRLEGWRAPG